MAAGSRGASRLVKGAATAAVLSAAAVWVRAYALLAPLALAVWLYVSTDAFVRLAAWVERRSPLRRGVLSWGLAAVFAALVALYVQCFVVSLGRYFVPETGARLCLVNKMKYGVARRADSPDEYYRTLKLGSVARGDRALVETPGGRMALRVVARPGDTVRVASGALYVDGALADRDGGVVADYALRPHAPYSAVRQMGEVETRREGASADTAARVMTLPVVLRESMWRPYTYAPVFRNRADSRCYPWNATYQWNAYHWGPMRMPRRGDSVELTYANVMLYGPMVSLHEGVTLTPVEGGRYVFKLDYYMTMTDNRSLLCDGRCYGPVPESKIVSRVIVL